MDQDKINAAISERAGKATYTACQRLQSEAQAIAKEVGLPESVMGCLAGDLLGRMAFAAAEDERATVHAALRDVLADKMLHHLLNVAEEELADEVSNAKTKATKPKAKKKTTKKTRTPGG